MTSNHKFSIDNLDDINISLQGLLSDENNPIANMANAASLLWHSMSDINWAGFYLYDKTNSNLVLGPFNGKPACVRIALGKGVCGTAYSTNTIQRIADVHAFPGHIACDSTSNSEIVLPMIYNNQILGVLDIDSPVKNRFTKSDENGLKKFVEIIMSMTDFSLL